jgi:hypothetical protein
MRPRRVAELVDQARPKLGRLGAHDDISSAEDEGRHARDAHRPRLGILRRHAVAIRLAREQPPHHRAFEPDGLGCRHQHVMRAEILPGDQVAAEKLAGQAVLRAFDTRPSHQAMGVERVRLPRDPVEMQLEPCGGGGLLHLAVNPPRGRLAAEFGGEMTLPVRAFRWNVGIELKGPPADRERVLFRRLQRPVETRLADIAPGAARIRDDVEPGGYGIVSRNCRRRSLPFALRGSAGTGWKARGHL